MWNATRMGMVWHVDMVDLSTWRIDDTLGASNSTIVQHFVWLNSVTWWHNWVGSYQAKAIRQIFVTDFNCLNKNIDKPVVVREH